MDADLPGRARGVADAPTVRPHLHDGAIHLWFSLSYASYLVLPRALLQEMPHEWQDRFVALLDEMAEAFDTSRPEISCNYAVQVRGADGRFVDDPLRHYRRPDMALIESLKGRK
jgi:hypothetical protein